MRACVFLCVHACVCVCVCACVRARVCVCYQMYLGIICCVISLVIGLAIKVKFLYSVSGTCTIIIL